MNKTTRTILAGSSAGVFLTLASFVTPGGMINNDQSVGVARPTPSVSTFPPTGTVPVVTPSPSKSSQAPSKRPAAAKRTQIPTRVSETPRASQSAVRATPKKSATSAPTKVATRKPTPKKTVAPAPKVTTISGYSFCGSAVAAAQKCIDQGKLTLYYPAGVSTLAGHNYMGWYWMDDLPIGRTVKITSGGLAGTYKVYAHGWAKRGSAGGKFPSAGYGAAVALQTCTDTGTGFSFLRRI